MRPSRKTKKRAGKGVGKRPRIEPLKGNVSTAAGEGSLDWGRNISQNKHSQRKVSNGKLAGRRGAELFLAVFMKGQPSQWGGGKHRKEGHGLQRKTQADQAKQDGRCSGR